MSLKSGPSLAQTPEKWVRGRKRPRPITHRRNRVAKPILKRPQEGPRPRSQRRGVPRPADGGGLKVEGNMAREANPFKRAGSLSPALERPCPNRRLSEGSNWGQTPVRIARNIQTEL